MAEVPPGNEAEANEPLSIIQSMELKDNSDDDLEKQEDGGTLDVPPRFAAAAARRQSITLHLNPRSPSRLKERSSSSLGMESQEDIRPAGEDRDGAATSASGVDIDDEFLEHQTLGDRLASFFFSILYFVVQGPPPMNMLLHGIAVVIEDLQVIGLLFAEEMGVAYAIPAGMSAFFRPLPGNISTGAYQTRLALALAPTYLILLLLFWIVMGYLVGSFPCPSVELFADRTAKGGHRDGCFSNFGPSTTNHISVIRTPK
ncbi:hypothetical protein HDU96_007297 [Phlyctochytrium bullatum]|nr:hypothetical protein HDU96_007297 [Phlyctochytrium bullatum]